MSDNFTIQILPLDREMSAVELNNKRDFVIMACNSYFDMLAALKEAEFCLAAHGSTFLNPDHLTTYHNIQAAISKAENK